MIEYRLAYEPTVLVIRDGGEWRVALDWEEAYKGYYDELGNFYSYIEDDDTFVGEGDRFLGEWLAERGLLDVSIF